MLSAIGRAAVRRVVAGGPQSTNRAFQSIQHLRHVRTSHDPKNSSVRSNVPSYLGRSYTTATKVVPKPKATKSKTAKPKKAVAKKAAKKPVKKPVRKPAKKKVVKKLKPKPKGRPRKPLTEEQVKKVALKELKAKALSLPKKLPQTAWTVLTSEYTKEYNTNPLGTGLKGAAAKYKSLSPAELESYNHIANQNKATNAIALKQWVESHTPEQIRIANNARFQLKTKDPVHRTWTQIPDDRHPKQPRQPLNFFTKERHASGDLKGISLAENARLLAREWAALSPSERKTYEDLAVADKQRYAQEFKTVFQRDPEFVRLQKAA